MKELKINENRETIFCECPPFPKNMLMELTNGCNHRCIFCGNHDQKRRVTVADKKLFFGILLDAHNEGTTDVGFYMNGEPLLVPDLCEYVDYAKHVGYDYIYLTTNGALLTPDRFERLAIAGISSIKFSVNAATRLLYKEIHGRDDYENVRHNIIEISRINREKHYGVSLFISFIKNSLNHKEIDTLRDTFSALVDQIYVFDIADQAGFNKDINKLKLPEQTGLFTSWPCAGLFNRLHVTSDGYLDACCADYDNSLVVEDLHKMSITDAWNSKRFRSIRKHHLEKTDVESRCYYCMLGEYVEDIKPFNNTLFNQ